MRMVSNYLICEDKLQPCDAIFVLSGNPGDRSAEAARLFKSGYSPLIICTGESVPRLFEIVNIQLDEADLSKRVLLEKGIPESRIDCLHKGTSTREESIYILALCKSRGYKRIMVVSDKYHTNRINYAFRHLYKDAGIELILRGAHSSQYLENLWWASETGLLMVNNEYVKLIYYYIKY
jgi:uncharacterized SAM-binding protein YcdF (DUF218 family)